MIKLSALGLALVASAGRALGAANIENGFVLDGVTTYCQGVNGARGSPLEFNALEAHNAGRCPIDIKLDLKATTVGTVTPTDVQWAASVRADDVPNNIFPRAIDAATKKPQDVIASLLRACKAGTNCAPESVIVPQVAGDGAEVGAFDAQGRRPLRPYRFQFKDPGQYIIVGVVTLPGDNALNVSASEFMAFQKITVVDGVGPATVSPPSQQPAAEVGGEAKTTSNINFQTDLAKAAPASSPVPASSSLAPATGGGVDASFSGNNKSSGSSSEKKSDGGNLTTMLTIGGVGVVMVVVLLYFVVVRRKNRRALASNDKRKPLDPHSEAGIFRLSHSNNNDLASSLSMGASKKRAASDSASIYSGGSSLAPPRFTAASNASSADSGPFGRATQQTSGDFPSYENATLAASGKEFQASRRNDKRVSVASSGFSSLNDEDDEQDVGTFGNLHDSAESLPTIPKKKGANRASVASSVSSYSYDRESSRMFSEVSRPASEYSTSSFSDRASEFSYSTDRRSTELGALSERGTHLGEYEV